MLVIGKHGHPSQLQEEALYCKHVCLCITLSEHTKPCRHCVPGAHTKGTGHTEVEETLQ